MEVDERAGIAGQDRTGSVGRREKLKGACERASWSVVIHGAEGWLAAGESGGVCDVRDPLNLGKKKTAAGWTSLVARVNFTMVGAPPTLLVQHAVLCPRESLQCVLDETKDTP